LRELKVKADGGSAVTLIETLAAYEYERGHLPGAINIPSNQIAELSASVLPDKSAEIVLYCAGPKCHASENASLAALNFRPQYRKGKLPTARPAPA
jgi:rhodanese-related sulfurtransferase